MKPIYLLVVIFLTFSSAAKAQILTNRQIAEHVQQTLRDNYKPDTSKLLRLCKQASVFVKFEVNRRGIISHIAFSNDSTRFVEDALRTAIVAL